MSETGRPSGDLHDRLTYRFIVDIGYIPIGSAGMCRTGALAALPAGLWLLAGEVSSPPLKLQCAYREVVVG